MGEPTSSTSLYVTFPDINYDEYNVNIGSITVTEPKGVVMKSDTTSNFSLKQGASYTFKLPAQPALVRKCGCI